MFELTFSDGITRGMTCDGHAPVYMTKRGSQIVPADWKRFRRALDTMPDGMTPAPNAGATGHEREAEERLTKLRRELETLIGAGGLDLLDESKGKIIELLNRHCGSATKARRADATDKSRHRLRAHDDDDDDDAFAEYLRGRGLGEGDIEEAKRIVASYEAPASDRLPISGPRHAALAREWREPGEKVFRGRDIAERFPEVMRVKSHYVEPEGSRRMSAADKRLAYDAGDAEQRLLKKYGNDGPGRIGIGMWPKRTPA
jgi:hypothetical protein